ncbi:4Fe-4S binding protein [Rhodovibrio salinarum]|uniref:4Fe-4S ferredoxin n=1 Tax=Rhodovibrio salinarum TaxID=1087 RepID=A0A934QND8_9PROT|nr:4Fe-4S binding protein [Rhodovibrio salinarum]MBK1699294.1 4Fe-4S ferredoxin [Rhodovibrio salinarum]
MHLKNKRVLVCNCARDKALDPKKLTRALHAVGADGEAEVYTSLCRAQLDSFQNALAQDRDVLVTCAQEAPLFREVAAEEAPEAGLAFANLREKALWSDEAKQAHPKMAALVAEAALDLEPMPTVAMESAGTCLIYGRDETAIALGRQLSDKLDVTVLLADPGEIMPPRTMDVPVFKGRIRELRGHLGGFGVMVDDYAPALPATRQSLQFELGRNGAFSECDLVIDVTGEDPLVRAPDKRDGYLRAAPDDPARVQRIAFEAADLVGTFEKPKYVAYDPSICAHGRSRKTGCTNCLDACPTGAIQSLGETVEIDPYVCAGCGSCASVCPTGAASYNLPRPFDLGERLRTLIGGYLKAGGTDPVLLIHDAAHGEEQIAMMARYGRGLPARVLPFQVNEVTQIGLDALSAAFGYGAARVVFLVPPAKRREGELDGLETQIATMDSILAGMGYRAGRITLIEEADPDAVEAHLWDLDKPAAPEPGTFLAMGGKRSRTMLGLRHLYQHAPTPQEIVPLPQGAPFGRVHVDTQGCTMCLACVSACPTGAMLDDPDSPWLGFNEETCIQCGLCATTCPENVIQLEPRLNLSEDARSPIELNRQEPFHCVRCGKPFGVESSIRRIADQLAEKHWMFQRPDQVERIMMCDDCRVVVQFESGDTPYKHGEVPRPRTTDDYKPGTS